MIIEIILAVIVILISWYFFLQLKSKLELNKLRRNYVREQDPSRKSEPGSGITAIPVSDSNRESVDTQYLDGNESKDGYDSEPTVEKKRGRAKGFKVKVVPKEEVKDGEPKPTEQPITDDKPTEDTTKVN